MALVCTLALAPRLLARHRLRSNKSLQIQVHGTFSNEMLKVVLSHTVSLHGGAAGMYDTLRPELLTATEAHRTDMARDPVSVVTWDLFKVTSLLIWSHRSRLGKP